MFTKYITGMYEENELLIQLIVITAVVLTGKQRCDLKCYMFVTSNDIPVLKYVTQLLPD